MDKQEIFNKVLDHFLIKEQPFSYDSTGCKYRGPNNSCCAVGLFIPDSEYNPKMDKKEGMELEELLKSGLLNINGATYQFLNEHKDFLYTLQKAHDAANFISYTDRRVGFVHETKNQRKRFAQKMREIGEEYQLDIEVLKPYIEEENKEFEELLNDLK